MKIRGLCSILAAVAALAISAVAQAQTPPAPELGPVLTNAGSRDGRDLSGTWTYSIDPYRAGLYDGHGAPANPRHQRFNPRDVDAEARANPRALFEYDMRRSPQTTLPGAWLAHDESLRHYDGLVWYQRRFEQAALTRGARAFLRFEAVNYHARVYLNGVLAGEHRGGFTPFALEVTTQLAAGENVLTVAVDSQRNADTVPPTVTDWETYGGITRAMRLVITPATFVDDAWVRLTRDGRIAATVELDGAAQAGRDVTVRIPALGVSLRGRTDAEGVWRGDTPAPRSLRRWSPDAPQLYDVVVETRGDALRDRVGFRTLEVRGPDILLNGEPIFLRGICLHEEEFGENPARIITPEAARALLTEAKEGLGANFVRLAHYPHSEITTRLADEMGLLVWSEIPVYWAANFASAETLETARRMLAENIRRDRNRASIAFWSVANETPLNEARNAFLGTLVSDVRALDDTRLVTAALLTARREVDGRIEIAIDDPLIPLLDVMSVNEYYGWYGDDALEDLPNIAWRSDYGKPLIFSEFGADALAGFHDPELQRKFSEEYQAEFYRQTLAMADRIPFLRGTAPWILKDFRSPRRQHPIYQQGWNRKGLVSETGVRKAAFFVLADYYRRRAAAETP